MLTGQFLDARGIAWFAGFMLVFWAPLPGGHRGPSFALFLLGVYLHGRSGFRLLESREARRFGFVFLLLFVPCAISTPFSIVPLSSLVATIVLGLYYWVGLALIHGMRQGGHGRLAWWVGVTLLFWAMDGAIQFLFGVNLFGSPIPDNGRVLGLFVDNMNLGRFLTVLMPLLLWPLARCHPWLALALFGLLSALASLTGMRTNIVFALLVAAGLFMFLDRWKHKIALPVLCLSPLLVIPFSPPLQDGLMDRDYAFWRETNVRQDPNELHERIDDILTHRWSIWETGWRMAQDRPLVGVGPHAFDPAYREYATRNHDPYKTDNGSHVGHAHQMYVSALAETGFPGLAGMVASVWLGWRWYRDASAAGRRKAAPFATSLAVIVFPINSQPVLTAGWWFPIVLLLFCAMLVALEEGDDKGGE